MYPDGISVCEEYFYNQIAMLLEVSVHGPEQGVDGSSENIQCR